MQFQKWVKGTVLLAGISLMLVGCGNGVSQAPNGSSEVLVNGFTAYVSDAPLMEEYSGTVMAQQEVAVKARVTGYIKEKYVQGGEKVEAGQALYKIDSRQYESTLAGSQANVAQAQANYENAVKDLERYQMLLSENAISEQQYTRQKTLVEQYKAVVDANQAQASMAVDNVEDTIVRAPFSGTLGVDDIPVGIFVQAGVTPLVTISSMDPVYVKFDLSESEYLKMAKSRSGNEWGRDLKLRLSDGSIYEKLGEVVVIDQGSTAGNFTIKAAFSNEQNLLRPGMFVNVVSDTQIAKDSVLVPKKAVQPLLNKEFVTVIDGENKVQQRPVQTGNGFGQYVVVTEGLKAGEVVVVEGQGKVHSGQSVKVKMLTKDDIEDEGRKMNAAKE